jgi:quinol monooxygenase YgiN
MATILAHIHIHPGRERDFEAVASSLHRTTHAHEDGVRHYEYWRGSEPNLYYCLLAFDDFHAFLRHQTSNHHESASPELGKLIAKMRLEWVDPVAGASKLPQTEMLPLPDEADALTERYHEIYAAKIEDWWRALRADSDTVG